MKDLERYTTVNGTGAEGDEILDTPDDIRTFFLKEAAHLVNHPKTKELADLLLNFAVEIVFRNPDNENRYIFALNVSFSRAATSSRIHLILESLQNMLSWEILPADPILRVIKDHNLLLNKPLLKTKNAKFPLDLFGDLYPRITNSDNEHTWSHVFSEPGKAVVNQLLRHSPTTKLIYTLSSDNELDCPALLVAVDPGGFTFVTDRGKITSPDYLPMNQANAETLEHQISSVVHFYQRMTPLEELSSRAIEGKLRPEQFSQRREQISHSVATSNEANPENQPTLDMVKSTATHYLNLLNDKFLNDSGSLVGWQKNNYPPHEHYLGNDAGELVKWSVEATSLRLPDGDRIVVYIPLTRLRATNYGPGKAFIPEHQFIVRNPPGPIWSYWPEDPKWVEGRPKQPVCVVTTFYPYSNHDYPCCPHPDRTSKAIDLALPEERFHFELKSTLIEQTYALLYKQA